MTEYRFTKPGLYPEGCPGHTDPRERQGYYIEAESLIRAIQTFQQLHPKDRYGWEIWRAESGTCPICGVAGFEQRLVHHLSSFCSSCRSPHFYIQDGSLICAQCGTRV